MKEFTAAILLVVLVGVLVAVLLGFPTMWLWNALMPDLFSLPTITFWEAVGLCLLGRFLFGTGSSTSSSSS